MNQLFKLSNPNAWKSLLLTEDSILIANKSYHDEAAFLENFHEKGLLKQRLELSYLDITKLTHTEKESNSAVMSYNLKISGKPLLLVFENATERDKFVQTVVAKRKFTGTVSQVSILKAIGSPFIGLAVTAFVTFAVYTDAQIVENGGVVNTSGRKALYKKLFAWLGEQLGTQGALIAGSIVALICLFFVYKNLKARPNEIVYS